MSSRHNKPGARVVPAERDSRRLTDQWRQRVAHVRLNRKGQPKLTIPQLIQEGRDAGYIAVAKAKGLPLWTRDSALARKAPRVAVKVLP